MKQNKDIGELMRSAGRRREIPAEDLAAIKGAAKSEWRKTVAAARGRRFRARAICALAACVLIVLLGGWWWLADKPFTVPLEIATVELSSGEIGVGDAFFEGELIEAIGPVAVRMTGGQSVRLEDGTLLRFISGSLLELESGALYVDSDPTVVAGGKLEIGTPFGLVREIGTQYEVRISEETDSLRLSVREGSVSIRTNGESHSAARGEQLTLQSDGTVARATVALDGPVWQWVLEAAPAPEIEGQSLAFFLDWISRETGWEVHYADEEIAASALKISLHGTIEGLRPDESLGIVLQGSGLDYHRDDGAVVIVRP
jgi:ferric-dicitrate binding protein FerR (iron transport regulator)